MDICLEFSPLKQAGQAKHKKHPTLPRIKGVTQFSSLSPPYLMHPDLCEPN